MLGGLLDQFTPPQRTALLVGVPVVAIAVIVKGRAGGADPAPVDAPTAPDPTGTIGAYMPSTDAIGTGQLATFETGVTDKLIDLTTTIQDLINKPATTPVKPPLPVVPTVRPTVKPAAPTQSPLGGAAPFRADGSRDPMLGRRNTVVKMLGTQPETVNDLARRLYRSSSNWQVIKLFNASRLPANVSGSTRVPAGTPIKY